MTLLVPIGDVERQTGIAQATLRIWERRYGFPRPLRDQFGRRVYPVHQLERLLKIRRLLDQGHRAGKLLGDGGELVADAGQPAPPPPHHTAIEMLRQYRLTEFRRLLQMRLMELGLRRFVIDVLAPLVTEVGDAWEQGWLPVRCEHAFSEQTTMLMHSVLATLPKSSGHPLVLLATMGGEQHGLGSLMAEAVLTSLGTPCLQFGTGLPMAEIVEASRESGADIVALSFSTFMSRKQVTQAVASLRAALPPQVELWAGGGGVPQNLRAGAGVRTFDTLDAIEAAIAAWRKRHAPAPLRRSAGTSG